MELDAAAPDRLQPPRQYREPLGRPAQKNIDQGDLRYRHDVDPGAQTWDLLQALNIRQLPTPTFDGKGDVLQFVEQFEEVTELNDWPEAEAFFRLKNALTGAAARGIKDCTNCGEVYEQLQTRFKLSETRAAQLLKALEWRPTEDAYEFADYV